MLEFAPSNIANESMTRSDVIYEYNIRKMKELQKIALHLKDADISILEGAVIKEVEKNGCIQGGIQVINILINCYTF